LNTWTVNSEPLLQAFIGEARELFRENKHVRFSAKIGKDRSLDQNAISHAWYAQLARELREDDALGWKCYCKLHHGVPILRAEDETYRETYDAAIKPMAYEKKLIVMRQFPVTSLMKKKQLSVYLESIQADFSSRGVNLEFPA